MQAEAASRPARQVVPWPDDNPSNQTVGWGDFAAVPRSDLEKVTNGDDADTPTGSCEPGG